MQWFSLAWLTATFDLVMYKCRLIFHHSFLCILWSNYTEILLSYYLLSHTLLSTARYCAKYFTYIIWNLTTVWQRYYYIILILLQKKQKLRKMKSVSLSAADARIAISTWSQAYPLIFSAIFTTSSSLLINHHVI